ncbi:hypothetical protein ACFXI0_07790 [Kitasatospora indigofera]|uniref:hypothetical protein n=1 Tax=Kitasatospora indigofera TaxID=67307 RepID=UPI0036C84A63
MPSTSTPTASPSPPRSGCPPAWPAAGCTATRPGRDLAVPGHHRIGPWVLSRHPGARDLTLWRLPEWDCARHAPDDEGDWTIPAIWSPHLPCSCPRHSRWLEIVLALAGPDLPQAPGEEPPF